jgi:mono/diheme cytochrome c family protein
MSTGSRLILAGLAALANSGLAAAAPAEGAPVTYNKDLLPILQKNCEICHRPGGSNLGGMVAPMSFTTYETTRPWAKAMAKAVSSQYMPPWGAAPQHHGVFEGERVLTKAEIDTIVRWVETGAGRGNPTDAPAPLVWPAVDGWTIGEPDLVISMPKPYFVPDDLLDETKYFPMQLTDDQLPESRWIRAVEFRPGSEVVHHIICTPFGGIAPGNAPNVYRDGYSAKIEKGAQVVWNMHYHKEPGPGTGMWDQSSVGVKFYPKDYQPKHVLTTIPLGPMDFSIPAGDPDYASGATHTFQKDALINSMMPHMHYRGKAVHYELIYPNGKHETLLDVPRYDFNWQTAYRLKEPKAVPAGTKLEFTGWWDNSAKNPYNPDPNINVTWGEATHEEMLFGWVSFTNVEEDATAHQGFARENQ